MEENRIDIEENYIYKLDNELLEILLKDRSSKENIIWATFGLQITMRIKGSVISSQMRQLC